MDDDLYLELNYLCKEQELHKVIVTIEHGMNNELGEKFKYYAEEGSLEVIKQKLPLHISNHIEKIVAMNELNVFDVVTVKED